jgi:hypothetical protein
MVLASMAIPYNAVFVWFRRAKLSVSKIQSRLLKTRNDTTSKKYLQSLRGIMQSIDECAKKVKEIQTSTLVSMFAVSVTRMVINIISAHHSNRTPTSII